MHLKTVRIHRERFPVNDRYPYNLSTIQNTGVLSLENPVTFFIGENGSGKSTLLEAISRKCGIYIWGESDIITHTPNPWAQTLHSALSIEWTQGRVPGSFFGSQVFRAYTKIIEEWAISDPGILEYYGGKSLLTLSHGQSILTFFAACFKVKGLYLLDEPEAGLSPVSQRKLLQLMRESADAGTAQFIIATHSPIILSYSNATVYTFDTSPVTPVDYTSTEHYRIYRDLFKNC